MDNIYKLHLEGIASGGAAVAHIDGKTVFVEGGAPDETALCRIIEEHKTWLKAELLEIISASPVRIDATCAFYGKCGGCNLQHIEYDAQLAAKTAILKDSFCRIAGFSPPEPAVFPCRPWEYRNRMQFHCFRQLAHSGNINFGLKGRNSGDIIAVTDCPIAEAGISELLRGEEKAITLPPEKDRFTVFSNDGLLLSEGGTERGKIKLLEREVILDAGVFFQSNIMMLEKLISEMRHIAENADFNLPMADLYCGVGTFAVFLSDLFPKVIAAEENKKAVSLARENLRGRNAEFFALRDTDWKTLLCAKPPLGFAVVDPPRTGLSTKTASALVQNAPPLLAYVSCDPSALARDAKILTEGSYKLTKLSLFDFYPQTAHIESLAVFEK